MTQYLDSNPLRKTLLALVATGLAIVLVHLLWSGVVAILLAQFYDHRLIDVRKLKHFVREAPTFANTYLQRAAAPSFASSKKTVLLVGSSVTRGYPWQEQVIFSRELARRMPDHRFSNLSVLGTNMVSLAGHPLCLVDPQRKPDILILEIPLLNSVSWALTTKDPEA